MKLIAFCRTSAVVAAGLGLGLVAAHAEEGGHAGPRALPSVEVSALRDPVAKSYRRMVKGIEFFERQRNLAPAAPLRFRLIPRQRDADLRGVALKIVGETTAIPVAVAADNTFNLGRFPQALAEDALVVPDRRAGTMTWRTDIRTPGLPPDTRRLGDLRLECLVGLEAGLVSNTRRSFLGELGRLLTDNAYCEQRIPHYLFFADRPLWSVTLVHGSRTEVLPIDELYAGSSRESPSRDDLQHCDCEVLLDRTFYAPLGDPGWPDDTLLVFEYMDPRQEAQR
ncbi:MAG: hypothetical protein ACXWUM_00945 [Burkholderiaceae bacterium]